ncbi:hypothetical protein A2U01_0039921 [Trifolium medium]|uniref:Uncharacterized protein n=1 Tax=Trifolium medium TaxID=97028 RepID=A0A392Q5E3_9FABA|nr:hypothetical protein [Trifolium medium]
MGRSLLIRDRELASSGIFLGRVMSGGLETAEHPSKNEIRGGFLLGGICFGIFIGVPLIYGAFVFVVFLLQVSARLV